MFSIIICLLYNYSINLIVTIQNVHKALIYYGKLIYHLIIITHNRDYYGILIGNYLHRIGIASIHKFKCQLILCKQCLIVIYTKKPSHAITNQAENNVEED